MNHLNQELLKARLMRGVCTGPAEQEKEPMKRCNGVLESGRRCSVVPLPGHEYCKSCEAKEARGEMPALKPAVLPVEPVKRGRPKTVTSDNSAVVREDRTAETDHLAGADKLIEPDEKTGSPVEPFHMLDAAKYQGPYLPQLACEVYGCPNPQVDGTEFCGAHQHNVQIPPVAPDPPQEQVAPCVKLSSGLARLLRPIPPPPPMPDGLLIPFTHEETVALIESDVSAEDIRQFVLLGLQGEVCRIDHEDPLAKSRHAAG